MAAPELARRVMKTLKWIEGKSWRSLEGYRAELEAILRGEK